MVVTATERQVMRSGSYFSRGEGKEGCVCVNENSGGFKKQ